jgi:hypothetical protein
MKFCANCDKSLSKRHQIKFCSNVCQKDYQHKSYIAKWKDGVVNGNRGIISGNISAHLKRYLFDKFNEKCVLCGWNKTHPITGNTPLEIDHIDGDAENNNESNLRLLCPNCHSLTTHFKNLNKGRGRKWRKEKYIKN